MTKQKILLVEDFPLLVNAIKQELESVGYAEDIKASIRLFIHMPELLPLMAGELPAGKQ